MEVSHTKKSTRIIIWVITIVMTAGFIGTYFLMMINTDPNAQQSQAQEDSLSEQPQPVGSVDPTAFRPEGDVIQLQVTDLVVGTGETVPRGATVTAHYKGTLANGVKFESSYDIGEPITVPLDNVIQGWKEGIPGMKVGGKRRLVIPSEMAYGPSGSRSIPPNSDLVFEVEILGVKPAAVPTQ